MSRKPLARAARGLLLPVLLVASGCFSSDEGPEQHSVDFYNHNAQHFYAGGHYRQALDQFEKALLVEDDDPTALLGRAWSHLMLSEALIRQGEPEGADHVQLAEEQFALLAEEDLGEFLQYKVPLGRGKAYVLLGDLYGKRAEQLREQAKRRPAGNPRIAKADEADAASRKNYRLAEEQFGAVISWPDIPAAQDNLTALLELARLAELRQDFGKSQLFAERYLEQVRRSKDLWIESLRRYPEDQAIWEGRLAGAVHKEVLVRDYIANLHFKQRRFGKAETELTQVLLLDPDQAMAYLDRGIVREELGKKAEALADYREFLVHAAMLDMDAEDLNVIEATKRLMRLEKELGLKPTVPSESARVSPR